VDAPSRWSGRWKRIAVGAVFLTALAAALIPLTNTARRAARHQQRVNNLKQIYLALANFDDVYRRLPPPVRSDEAGRPLCSWRFQILPFVEAMMNRLDFGDRWDDPSNRWLLNMYHPIYCWSTDRGAGGLRCTNVAAITGPGTAFDCERTVRLGEIPANTVCLIEIHDSDTYWMEPGDLRVDNITESIVRGIDGDGVHVLFADGTVWFISADVPFNNLRKLFTTKGAAANDRERLLGPYALRR
jgi:hypothetical protein